MSEHIRSAPMGSDRVISFKATKGIHKALTKLAKELGVSRSEAVRIALQSYIDNKEKT